VAKSVLEIILEAKDKASKALKGTGKEVKNLGKSAQAASRGTQLLAKAGTAMLGAFSIAAVAKIAATVKNLSELGAKAQSLERSLSALAGGAQQAAGWIEAIKSASGDTISEMDAMQAAITAQTLGVAENAAQMGQLTEIAVTLGRAQGITATQAISDLTTALGRQSPMILDNLGITMKLSEAYEGYAAKLGKSASALTDAEKKQAFINEALSKGAEVADQLGGSVANAASSAEASTAAWVDLGAEVGRRFTGALKEASVATADFARSWADALKTTREMPVRVSELNSQLQQQIKAHGYTEDVLDRINNLSEKYNWYLEANSGQLADYAAMEQAAAAAAGEHADVMGQAEPMFVSQAKINQTLADRYQGQADALGIVSENSLDARDAIAEQAAAAEEAAAKQQAYQEALAESARAAGELSMSLKDATEAEIAKEMVGMLDPEELGAEAYGAAVQDIGLAFDLMDEKSIALASTLPQLAEAINEGVIPAEQGAEALSALVEQAETGQVNFSALVEQFGAMPASMEEMKAGFQGASEALTPIPALAGSTAEAIASTGNAAATAAGQISSYVDAVGQIPSSVSLPTATGGGGATAASVPGYQHGGIVPGPRGRPQLAMVHGGEQIIPAYRGGGGGGGTMTVHINVGTVMGDDMAIVDTIADRITQRVKQAGGYRGGMVRGF